MQISKSAYYTNLVQLLQQNPDATSIHLTDDVERPLVFGVREKGKNITSEIPKKVNGLGTRVTTFNPGIKEETTEPGLDRDRFHPTDKHNHAAPGMSVGQEGRSAE